MMASKTAATRQELIIIWDEIMKYQDILICISILTENPCHRNSSFYYVKIEEKKC